MNSIYQQALNGSLKSVPGGDAFTCTVPNHFEIPIVLAWIDLTGGHAKPVVVHPGKTAQLLDCYAGYYYLVTSLWSGAFMCAFNTSQPGNYPVSCSMLTPPNDIGTIPVPTSSILIPPDSPRVQVGCGTLPNGHLVVREQYWDRLPDSYCLAPSEERTVGTTTMAGKQETSSKEEVLAESLGLSVTAGWGPISAGISASLSNTSSTYQQVTITEQVTTYVSTTLTNDGDKTVMYLRWQLVDVITIFKPSGAAIASTLSGESPALITGPYPQPSELEPSAPRGPVEADGGPQLVVLEES